MSTTIRVSDATKARIDSLAAQSGLQIQTLVERAVAQYERAAFFDQMNKRFAEIRGDDAGWADLVSERDQLDGALADWARADEAR